MVSALSELAGQRGGGAYSPCAGHRLAQLGGGARTIFCGARWRLQFGGWQRWAARSVAPRLRRRLGAVALVVVAGAQVVLAGWAGGGCWPGNGVLGSRDGGGV